MRFGSAVETSRSRFACRFGCFSRALWLPLSEFSRSGHKKSPTAGKSRQWRFLQLESARAVHMTAARNGLKHRVLRTCTIDSHASKEEEALLAVPLEFRKWPWQLHCSCQHHFLRSDVISRQAACRQPSNSGTNRTFARATSLDGQAYIDAPRGNCGAYSAAGPAARSCSHAARRAEPSLVEGLAGLVGEVPRRGSSW